MRQGGQAGILAVLFLILLLFVVYIAYSIFSGPVTQVIESVENTDTENVVPRHIFANIKLQWELWAIVMIVIGFLVAIAFVYHHEHERSYGGPYG